ncbi:hypothetical protein CIB43_00333 [Mesomycoplasma hyopneumoniae]|uniref:Uncharacterized protein n=1 Tax=Mesomycoplasma hyopneumoniae TaxID=2099 RepID=A0A223M9N5_MESHO|nr:hypothetical protein CIB43_00333 [Mesomycoplasma hyopneumoniae]
MKLAKFKKIILLLMFWPSIFLIYHSFLINFNTKKYWYASNFSNKIDIREPFAKQLSNSPKIDDFDNQFELKLLLNPNFGSTESKEISNFNLEFIKKIEKSRLKFKKAKMDKHKNDFDKWSKTHINSERLNLEATKKNQNDTWVSDYDLYLQKLDSNNNWVDVSWSTSIPSNDELIDFKAEKSGYYRLYIKKFKSATFDNSVEDKLALSYLVNNEK